MSSQRREFQCVSSSESITDMFDKLFIKLNDQEDLYLKDYTDALNIDNEKAMLRAQKHATKCIRLLKKWHQQLKQLRNEIEETDVFKLENKVHSESIKTTTQTPSLKIGKYVQERMRLLEQAGLIFTEEESNQVMDKDWSKSVLHLSKPFLKECDLSKTAREQIIDMTGNNRYWSSTYYFNGKPVFLCSQWYYKNKQWFDKWADQLAERVGIEFPERAIVKDAPESKRRVHKDLIPTKKQKVGIYIRERLRELEAIGVTFQKDYLDLLLTEEWAKKNFKVGFPLMKVVDTEKPIHLQIVDQNKKHRYWRKPFRFGNVDVFVCNEWHEYNRDLFDKWMKDLSNYLIKTHDQEAIKLTVTDYRMKRHR